MRAAALLVLNLVLGSCAGHGEPRDSDFPTCSGREVSIAGTLGTTIYLFSAPAASYAFVNAIGASPGHLDATFDAGGARALHLEWPSLVADGGSGAARGSIVTGSGATDLAFASCASDGYPGTVYVDADGKGGRFVLRDLRRAPGCGQPSVDGQLFGCFRSE